MTIKTCTICNTPKVVTDFYKSSRHSSGYQSNCKSCESSRKKSAKAITQRRARYKKNKSKIIAVNKAFRLKNLERSKLVSKAYYERNKDKALQHGWKQKGILNTSGKYFTIDDYKQALVDCNNVCEICGKNGDLHKKGLVVDHNHDTGLFRGILCTFCNTALSYMKDDVVILNNAIKYLKK